jgi:peptidylprolyl isomerase
MSAGESSCYPVINATTAQYCYLDFDLQDGRSQLACAAAFVDATNTRYHFSASDLLLLGGSELSRIPELAAMDHEWSSADLRVRPPAAGNRLIVQLDWSTAPLACENFATLCGQGSAAAGYEKGGKKKPIPMGESGKPLSYKNSVVHRVVPQFILQGGDFVFGNGSGGESIYGKKFKDERAGLLKKHDRRGILSMGNSGKNSNTSQFFITFVATPQCDGKHVIFGQVISGWEVLDALEAMGSSSGDPTGSITLTDCGLWVPFQTPPSGFWYDTPDPDSFSGVSSMFIVRPRVAVIGPNPMVLDKFRQVLRQKCTSVRLLPLAEKDAESKSSDVVVDTVQDLLRSFSVDVVLVAPACRDIQSKIAVPWSDDSDLRLRVDASKVIFECKPMDAVDTVYHQSWLQYKTENWKFDSGNV